MVPSVFNVWIPHSKQLRISGGGILQRSRSTNGCCDSFFYQYSQALSAYMLCHSGRCIHFFFKKTVCSSPIRCLYSSRVVTHRFLLANWFLRMSDPDLLHTLTVQHVYHCCSTHSGKEFWLTRIRPRHGVFFPSSQFTSSTERNSRWLVSRVFNHLQGTRDDFFPDSRPIRNYRQSRSKKKSVSSQVICVSLGVFNWCLKLCRLHSLGFDFWQPLKLMSTSLPKVPHSSIWLSPILYPSKIIL